MDKYYKKAIEAKVSIAFENEPISRLIYNFNQIMQV